MINVNLIVTLIIVKAQKRKRKKKASVLKIWEFPPTGRGDLLLADSMDLLLFPLYQRIKTVAFNSQYIRLADRHGQSASMSCLP